MQRLATQLRLHMPKNRCRPKILRAVACLGRTVDLSINDGAAVPAPRRQRARRSYLPRFWCRWTNYHWRMQMLHSSAALFWAAPSG